MQDCFVFLDKPAGITSFQAVLEVKRLFKARKAGHTGTLDTHSTGLLIIGLDDAVKDINLLMGLKKTYAGVMQLHKDIDKKELEIACKKFIGKITQLPPKKSAVMRKNREREIYYFKILSLKNKKADFEVECEAGTYIRKLVHDMGQLIGGANLVNLRRTGIGPFSLENAGGLEEIKKNMEKYTKSVEQVLEKIKYYS